MSAGHTEQLKAWALDRAIETHKHTGGASPDQIMKTAQSFVEWVEVKEAAEGDVTPEVTQ